MKNIFKILTGASLALSLSASAKPVAKAPERTISSHTAGHSSAQLWVGPSLLVVDGEVGFGIPISGYWHITEHPLYIGFESGFNHWSFPLGSANAIPMMMSAYYKVPFQGSSLSFLAGMSMGMTLRFLSTTYTLPVGYSSTKVFFEMLFEPGLMVPSQDLTFIFQPKFGILAGDFTFQPTAVLAFAI